MARWKVVLRRFAWLLAIVGAILLVNGWDWIWSAFARDRSLDLDVDTAILICATGVVGFTAFMHFTPDGLEAEYRQFIARHPDLQSLDRWNRLLDAVFFTGLACWLAMGAGGWLSGRFSVRDTLPFLAIVAVPAVISQFLARHLGRQFSEEFGRSPWNREGLKASSRFRQFWPW